MDVPAGPVEPEGTDELERLRRRAYGPDADIAGDVTAQARLSELEADQRRQPTPVVAAAAQGPDSVPDRVPTRSESESASAPQPIDRAAAMPRRRWRRRLAGVGGTVAGLALIGVALIGWLWPRAPDHLRVLEYDHSPDFTLKLLSDGADADEPTDPHDTLDRLGLDSDAMRRYEDFGYLSVWSGESRFGTTCVLVAHPVQGLNEGISAEACAPDGPDAIADLLLGPSDGLTRFVLKDEHVDVYVYERAADPSEPHG